MWLLFLVLHAFFLALTNYVDEHLTHTSTSKEAKSVHERVGGVLLISMLFAVLGALFMYILVPSVHVTDQARWLALLSAVPMVMTWIGYFYAMQFYSAHKVIPLFGFTSFWLLLLEWATGGVFSFVSLFGIFTLIVGGYFLDVGCFKWRIPSRLMLWFLPVTLATAIELFIIKFITASNPPLAIYFWHLVGIFGLGIMALFVPAYWRGLRQRVQGEGKPFLFFSVLNEGSAQIGYLFGLLSVAYAPLAVYFSAAVPGVQSLMLMLLFFVFPLDGRNHITPAQWWGMVSIGVGVALLELARLG